MTRARHWTATAVLAAAGCMPTAFLDFEDSAPAQVLEKPSGFVPGSFGSVLLAMAEESGGARHERLMVGARAATPIYSFILAEGDEVLPSDDEIARLCDPAERTTDEKCLASAIGSAVSAVPALAWTSNNDARLCLAIGGTGDAVTISCESGFPSQRWNGSTRSGFGVSVAWAGESLLLVGSNEDGARLVVGPRDDPSVIEEVDVAPCEATAPGFGVAVAAADQFWAIGSQGDEIVVTEPEDEGRAVLTVPNGHGSILTTVDAIGDESVDLLASGGGEIRIWDGDALAAAEGCDDVTPDLVLGCQDRPDDEVVCGAEFGAAVAVGDINADGTGELLVGDPSATVEGKDRAGAAFIWSLDELEGPPADALTDSTPEDGGELGRAVQVGSIQQRGEAIVGSDGEVFFFFCTELAGDRSGDRGLDGSCRAER